MNTAIQEKLDAAVKHIILTGTQKTTTGNYIFDPDDVPADILTPELFEKHVGDIARMMMDYYAVAEVDTADGRLDTIFYLAYCPNFEPDDDERDEYPDDRVIITDPLKSKRVRAADFNKPPVAPVKSSLLEKLEQGKQRAAQQKQSGTKKNNGLEV